MLVITVTIDDACIGAFATQVRVSSVMIARFVLREIHGDESDPHDHFYSRYRCTHLFCTCKCCGLADRSCVWCILCSSAVFVPGKLFVCCMDTHFLLYVVLITSAHSPQRASGPGQENSRLLWYLLHALSCHTASRAFCSVQQLQRLFYEQKRRYGSAETGLRSREYCTKDQCLSTVPPTTSTPSICVESCQNNTC